MCSESCPEQLLSIRCLATGNKGNLRNLIQLGWPEKQSQVPKEIQKYWNIHDQLSEVDGILLNREKLIIPNALRSSMIKRIHMGHMGIVKCSQRAREVMFWPGTNKAIKHTIANCDVCQEHHDSNPKEPMLPGPMPERPWEVVATNCSNGQAGTIH